MSPSTVSFLSTPYLAYLESFLVLSGFIASLHVALATHYTDLVKNHVARYPDEWFPSVSSVIGDFFPARNILHVTLALTSAPRFFNIYARFIKNGYDRKLLIYDVLRTLSIGGWVYITSCDSGTLHSTCMGSYVLFQMLYMFTSSNKTILTKALGISYVSILFSMMVPLYAHVSLLIPGAYSVYSVLEWILIPLDVAYDLSLQPVFKRVNVKIDSLYSVLNLTNDLWQSHLFWVNLTSLPALIWYFPLWNMGLSGFELCLLAYFSPVTLAFFNFPKLTHKILKITSALSLFGIFTSSIKVRLMLTSLSTASSMIYMCKKHQEDHLEFTTSLIHGLFAFSTVKHIYNSMHPMWSIYEKTSQVSISLFIFHCLISLYNSHKSNGRLLQSMVNIPASQHYRLALASGAALWILHTFFTDYEAISLRFLPKDRTISFPAWNDMITLVLSMFSVHMVTGEMTQSLFATNDRKEKIRKYGKVSTINFAFKTVFNSKLTIPFGVMLSLMSKRISTALFPLLCGYCTRSLLVSMRIQTGKHVFIVISTYVLLLLADMWTVAYAFVPFGEYLREKSMAVVSISIILLWSCSSPSNAVISLYPTTSKSNKRFLVSGTICFIMGISTMMNVNLFNNLSKSDGTQSMSTGVKYHNKDIMTTGIWTVHFGLNNDGYLSHKQIERLLRKMDVDVIGLLESDTMRPIGGNRNMLRYLARRLDMNMVYGPGPSDHTWGCSLLSRYPIVSHQSYLLPSPKGELACAVRATLRVPRGHLVDVVISHNGQEEDVLDRKLQTEMIAKIVRESDNPTAFAGYLVTKPGMEHSIYNTMVNDTGLTDIYSKDKRRWCQYIFYKKLTPIAYARVSHGNITDTELQTAKFWVGHKNVTHIQVPSRNLYSKDLIGTGWNGHRYHVYKKPIYGSALVASTS